VKHPILYITDAKGKVLAVQVDLKDWIALLEKLCDLQQKLRPTTALDKRLDTEVRKRIGNKKKVDLDDIGFIGTGRAVSEEESLLMSAHVQLLRSRNSLGKAMDQVTRMRSGQLKKRSLKDVLREA